MAKKNTKPEHELDFSKELKKQKKAKKDNGKFTFEKRNKKGNVTKIVNFRQKPNGDELFTVYYIDEINNKSQVWTYDETKDKTEISDWMDL